LNRSGLSETPPSKPSPATPRVSQLSRGVAKSESDSLSPLQSSRLSVDRSPRSINSKPTIDRRTPKVTRATPPEVSVTKCQQILVIFHLRHFMACLILLSIMFLVTERKNCWGYIVVNGFCFLSIIMKAWKNNP